MSLLTNGIPANTAERIQLVAAWTAYRDRSGDPSERRETQKLLDLLNDNIEYEARLVMLKSSTICLA